MVNISEGEIDTLIELYRCREIIGEQIWRRTHGTPIERAQLYDVKRRLGRILGDFPFRHDEASGD